MIKEKVYFHISSRLLKWVLCRRIQNPPSLINLYSSEMMWLGRCPQSERFVFINKHFHYIAGHFETMRIYDGTQWLRSLNFRSGGHQRQKKITTSSSSSNLWKTMQQNDSGILLWNNANGNLREKDNILSDCSIERKKKSPFPSLPLTPPPLPSKSGGKHDTTGLIPWDPLFICVRSLPFLPLFPAQLPK